MTVTISPVGGIGIGVRSRAVKVTVDKEYIRIELPDYDYLDLLALAKIEAEKKSK